MRTRPMKIVALLVVLTALAVGGTAFASSGGNGSDPGASSRGLDDGKDLAGKAGITIDQAISAAQSKASGPIGEIDLEYADGRLVYNVDVASSDVKVDADTGDVVRVDSDD